MKRLLLITVFAGLVYAMNIDKTGNVAVSFLLFILAAVIGVVLYVGFCDAKDVDDDQIDSKF